MTTFILLRVTIGISWVSSLVVFNKFVFAEGLLFKRAARPASLVQFRLTGQQQLWGASDDSENYDDDNDSDESAPTAYGNRSLAWTNRYRRLIPYEFARSQAMSLGLSSEEEWQAIGHQGPYMISRPDEMYQEEWISWDEFLGVIRPYEETKQLVQYVLKLKSMEEYRQFVKSDPKRAEGLRIPAKPDIVYKDKGWQGLGVFFGTSSTSTQ